MREVDLLLGRFAQNHLHEMSLEELKHFEALLQHSDQELYRWLFEKTSSASSIAPGVIRHF